MNRYQKVAVVGHGPSAKPCVGHLVDECDAVVRLWDWEVRGIDCGFRYDYGLLRLLHIVNVKGLRLPDKAWIGYGIEPDVYADRPVLHAYYGTFWDGRKMSRGSVAVCHVITSFKPTSMLLAGFDDVVGAVRRKAWPHDNVCEHNLIYRLAKHHNVEIIDVNTLRPSAS